MNIFYLKRNFFIFIFIVCLGMLILNRLNKGFQQDPLTQKSYSVFAELQVFVVNFNNGLTDVIKKYLFLLDLRQQNAQLEQQNKELKSKQQLLEELLQENQRFRQVLEFPKNNPLKLLATQIISHDFLSKDQMFIINKGSVHGVKPFMGVLHPQGVVGIVFRVSAHSSQIITLRHPLFSLPVRNKTSRQGGLLLSSLNSVVFRFWDQDFYLKDIPKDFQKKLSTNHSAGDVLISSGSDSFPSGLLVGEILPFKISERNINPDIYVKPFVTIESLEEVFVILQPFVNSVELKEKDWTEIKKNDSTN